MIVTCLMGFVKEGGRNKFLSKSIVVLGFDNKIGSEKANNLIDKTNTVGYNYNWL